MIERGEGEGRRGAVACTVQVVSSFRFCVCTVYQQDGSPYRNGDLSNGKVNHPQAKYVIQPLLPPTPFEDINEPQYPKLVSSLPPTEEEPEDNE